MTQWPQTHAISRATDFHVKKWLDKNLQIEYHSPTDMKKLTESIQAYYYYYYVKGRDLPAD